MITFSDALTNLINVAQAGNMSDAQRHASGWFDRMDEAEKLCREAWAHENGSTFPETIGGMARAHAGSTYRH